MWLTAVATAGPFLGPHGIYAPSQVTGAISWVGGAPFADATLTPSVEVWNNATTATPFSLALSVFSAAGALVATASGSGSAAAGAPGAASVTSWAPAAPLALPGAALWHLVDAPLKPALYTLVTSLTVGGTVVHAHNTTFGVRAAAFNASTGFWLNGVSVKIMGTANHQDYAAVGVAVPDHLQWHRVSKLKEMGVNGWRSASRPCAFHLAHFMNADPAFLPPPPAAHNPPTPALLDAMDELGMVCWDENHRNGQLDQVPLLIRRDRNHPSVVICACSYAHFTSRAAFAQPAHALRAHSPPPPPLSHLQTNKRAGSICNEVLCNTKDDWVVNANAMKALMHELDPLGGRPVSANQNGWLGPNTPLDLQGIDYSTGSYDSHHAATPTIPLISSETSSAVSDRGEYVDNKTAGHVEGYDNQYPGWGESAEQAWGGVGMSNGQGVLTRPFISGGWTWTGWDCECRCFTPGPQHSSVQPRPPPAPLLPPTDRGEPTPYAWPDVNSHFGILDLAGFEKDRFFWYKSCSCMNELHATHGGDASSANPARFPLS